jgi:hypothetical protein
MDEKLANKIDEITDRWYRNEDYCQKRHTINTFIALKLEENGYRLDHYPNGKSKGELLEIIDAKEAELARARNLLYKCVSTESMLQLDYSAVEEIDTFLAETSTVKS